MQNWVCVIAGEGDDGSERLRIIRAEGALAEG